MCTHNIVLHLQKASFIYPLPVYSSVKEDRCANFKKIVFNTYPHCQSTKVFTPQNIVKAKTAYSQPTSVHCGRYQLEEHSLHRQSSVACPPLLCDNEICDTVSDKQMTQRLANRPSVSSRRTLLRGNHEGSDIPWGAMQTVLNWILKWKNIANK